MTSGLGWNLVENHISNFFHHAVIYFSSQLVWHKTLNKEKKYGAETIIIQNVIQITITIEILNIIKYINTMQSNDQRHYSKNVNISRPTTTVQFKTQSIRNTKIDLLKMATSVCIKMPVTVYTIENGTI